MNHSDTDEKATRFLVSPINTDLSATNADVLSDAAERLRKADLLPSDAAFRIWKRSVDARRKDRIRLVWTVCVTGSFSARQIERMSSFGFRPLPEEPLPPAPGDEPLPHRPVIVGSGPAGLFCAYTLAHAGYRPILIERGGDIEERSRAVELFRTRRILDPSTNVQFGAGGAGTFSDGKLMTRISDPRVASVFRAFVAFGAPEDILTSSRPHVGTDVLRTVVDSMLSDIVSCGADIRYHTCLYDIKEDRIVTSDGDIPYGVLVLACGHSARDTYRMLLSRSFSVVPKAFSVGVRVEHLQSDIDSAMYGRYAGHPALGHADYALSCHTDTDRRGVYTFCMCPGGYVIAAADTPETVVVNGMSYRARDGVNANSAVAVSVSESDYGNTPLGAIAFQERIERAAYRTAGADYSVPLVTMGDFLSRRGAITEPSRVKPTYMDGHAYRLVSPDAYLPSFVCEGLAFAFARFDRSLSGFASPDAVITGPETRTSAPVRILRTEAMTAVGHDRVYPCGEGAGYAGGITSAAADGLRCAEAIIRRFRA